MSFMHIDAPNQIETCLLRRQWTAGNSGILIHRPYGKVLLYDSLQVLCASFWHRYSVSLMSPILPSSSYLPPPPLPPPPPSASPQPPSSSHCSFLGMYNWKAMHSLSTLPMLSIKLHMQLASTVWADNIYHMHAYRWLTIPGVQPFLSARKHSATTNTGPMLIH